MRKISFAPILVHHHHRQVLLVLLLTLPHERTYVPQMAELCQLESLVGIDFSAPTTTGPPKEGRGLLVLPFTV